MEDDDSAKRLISEEAVAREEPRCGWCCWKPDFLQAYYKWQLGFGTMCCFAFLQGFLIHGVNLVNTSSLERRFRLSGVEIGWFNSAPAISAVVSSILLSYLADRAHRPRWLMISAILFAIGCFTMSLPHFIAEPYRATKLHVNMCGSGQLAANQSFEDCSKVDGVSWWLKVLTVGSAITGIGEGIIYTVGVAFIDDFSDSASTSLRMGIMYLSSAVGSSAGFAGGSAMLQVNVNFNRPDWPQYQGDKDFNPNYVGAWWLGYVLGTACFGCVAFLFSCLDYEMPETAEVRKTKATETHQVKVAIVENASDKPKVVRCCIKFFDSIVKLICNPVLTLMTLAGISHHLVAEGLQPFLVTILSTQFAVTETKVGVALGILTVTAIGTANTFSGLVLKRGNFSLRTQILIVLCFVFLGTFFGLGFLGYCPQQKISGITVDYGNLDYFNPVPLYASTRLRSECNSECECSPHLYEPICQPDLGVQFFSPCHGGCTGRQITTEGTIEYTNCTCSAALQGINSSDTSSFQSFFQVDFLLNGVCDLSCPGFYGAMALLFFICFCAFFTMVPIHTIIIRCVNEENRSVALAFHDTLVRVLGAIPGPVVLGGLIDRVCLFREPTLCLKDNGACYVYDPSELAALLVSTLVVSHVIAIACYIAAFFVYKPPNGETAREYVRRNRCSSLKEFTTNICSAEQWYDDAEIISEYDSIGEVDDNL